jgi:hypothetical protein
MSREPFATNMVQGYQRALEIAPRDLSRFKGMGITSALVLAGYYNNIKADKATALTYINKGLELDSTHAQLKNIKDILSRTTPTKQPAPRGNSTPAKSSTKKAVTTKTTAVKPKTTTTSTANPVIKK